MNQPAEPSLLAVKKTVEVIPIPPPPKAQRVGRSARFAQEGERRDRYTLPTSLESNSPIGYRTRVSMTRGQAKQALSLLDLDRPTSFEADAEPVLEQALFEESSLGIMSARQSTNYMGHKQITLGARDSAQLLPLLRDLKGLDATPLEHATHTNVVLTRPYRTPFTLLLTFIGHKPVLSLATVGVRALKKKFLHHDDIPTIGYLQHLHVGILADASERAAIIASGGVRRAQVIMAPFCGGPAQDNASIIRRIEQTVGLTSAERKQGWRIAFVSQVGQVDASQRPDVEPQTYRLLGANLLAMRSERIQPGVNQEDKAPEPYQQRQEMKVPDDLTVMCGRAGYNAFVHWTGCERELSKQLVLLERIDVLTPNGKQRLREVRQMLGDITDRIMKNLPKWVDIPSGRLLSRNAAKGKKAFALAGQRIYIGGLDRASIEAAGIDWTLAVRAFGAYAARGALVSELMGCVDIPKGCDLLAGICLMAGPVNQNDIGKEFFGERDMLCGAFPDLDPTSLLVWTLKAKTVADPIGNEEQLLNASRKGALVDLRPGPHQVVRVKRGAHARPMREHAGQHNQERAFGDVGNFVTDPEGAHIPGNIGAAWPSDLSQAPVWGD